MGRDGVVVTVVSLYVVVQHYIAINIKYIVWAPMVPICVVHHICASLFSVLNEHNADYYY